MERLDGDEKLCKTIVEIFPGHLAAQMEKLRTALREKDAKKISLHGHTIKGMCANATACRLRDIAYQIEIS